MMKLRLRSTESNQTRKIEIPNPSTLIQLKQILSQTLPNSPPINSIRLSLNRKHDLKSHPGASLNSLGITSGDLIFYSIDNSSLNSSTTPVLTVSQPNYSNSMNSDAQKIKTSEQIGSSMEVDEYTRSETINTVSKSENSDFSNLDSQKSKTHDSDFNMDVDGESSELLVEEKSFSVPGFLRKMFMEELGNDSGHDHKLVVIAIHAVLLESGFVGFDMNANLVTNRLGHDVWPSSVFPLSLNYTLPEIETADTVVIKFQSMGKFVSVYGSLSCGRGGKAFTRMVRFNENQLVPFLNVVWANCGVKDSVECQNGSFESTVEKEVFRFWRTVKDNLALPLLIDICEKSGLELPPCFMRLPTDLKLKIVELLPAVEIAKVSSTCSEIRYLASSDELWKVKFEEKFGKNVKKGDGSWKMAFVKKHWEIRRGRTFATRYLYGTDLYGRRGFGYGRQPFPAPAPLFPGISGDYHMWPSPLRFANGGAHVNRLTFSPPCDLEGL